MIRAILGRRGSGKSRLARALLTAHPPERLAIIDPLAEHARLINQPEGMPPDWIPLAQQGVWPLRICPQTEEEYLLALAALAARPNHHLLLEECDMWEGPIASPELGRMVNYGRHAEQDLTAIARRPAAMPRIITSQADELWIFHMREPRDVAYVESYCGIDARDIPRKEVWLSRADSPDDMEVFSFDRATYALIERGVLS